MRLNNIYKGKIKLIFSGFIFLQIVIIIAYFKFGNIQPKTDLDWANKNFPAINYKLQYYKDLLNSYIPHGESVLRAIRGDIIALLFLISKNLKRNPKDLYNKIKINSFEVEDYLNKKTPTIPVLVIACNRSGVERTIKQVIKYRPNGLFWPLIISQGCDDTNTKELILKYREHIAKFVQNVPNVIPYHVKPQFRGYYKISAHYKLALDYVFTNVKSVNSLIIVEDDLDIAPDFFEYFSATYRLLKEDSTLYCVSAFNDNGRPELIDKHAYSTLFRTDFFPGLGWMLLKSTWLEIRNEWPRAFWDDHMRSLLVRRSRSCIRPEISRSSTFGQNGVSNGQFFNKYLKSIMLNKVYTNFSSMDLSYLYINNFDSSWKGQIDTALSVDWHEFRLYPGTQKTPVKIIYYDLEELQKICDSFGLMSDLRDGIARTSYKNVITFFWNSVRVFLIPAFST